YPATWLAGGWWSLPPTHSPQPPTFGVGYHPAPARPVSPCRPACPSRTRWRGWITTNSKRLWRSVLNCPATSRGSRWSTSSESWSLPPLGEKEKKNEPIRECGWPAPYLRGGWADR